MKTEVQDRLRSLKGILWDLDNTLYKSNDDLDHAFDKAVAVVSLENGVTLTLDDAIRLARRSYIDHGYSGKVFVETMGIDPLALHLGVYDLVDEKIIIHHQGLIDSMQSLLLHHVVVTHGARGWAMRVIEHLGLSSFFPHDRVHALEDFNFHKKAASRLPFEMGLQSLGLKPEEVIMVEDQERNLRIPHEMGMGTVLLDYGLPRADAAGYVDIVCRDAVELLTLIKKMRSS